MTITNEAARPIIPHSPAGVPTEPLPVTGAPVSSNPRQSAGDDDDDDLGDDDADSVESDDDDVDAIPEDGLGEEIGDDGFNDGLDETDEVDEFDDIDEDDFDDDFDDDFEEELGDDYEIEIDDEISAEFGLNTGTSGAKEDDIELEDFDDFDSLHRD